MRLPDDVTRTAEHTRDPLREGRGGTLARLAWRSAATAVPRAAAVALSLVLNVTLARWLGTAEYGEYSYVLLWMPIATMLGVLGLDNIALRELPVHLLNGEWTAVRTFIWWASTVSGVVSLALGMLVVVIRQSLVGAEHGLPLAAWLLAALLLVTGSVSYLQHAVLRALHRPVLSQCPALVQPAIVLALLASAIGTGFLAPNATNALFIQAIAALAMVATGAWLVVGALPATESAAATAPQRRRWLGGASWMFLLSILGTASANIDGILLGLLAGPASVGPYAIALKGAALIPTVFAVVLITVSPSFASLHAAGDFRALRRLAKRTARLGLLGGVPVAAALVFGGRHVLLLFGPDFQAASPALLVLCIGQLVNVSVGPVATLLVLTGHERAVIAAFATSILLNVLTCFLLVPSLGMLGAAVASAVGLVAWNVILRWFVRRLLASPAPNRG